MNCISARDIHSVAQYPYLVDQLVPAKSVTLISAPSNAGKTALLIHMATAFAERRKAFGTLNVRNDEGRSVLYVNGELTAFDFKSYAVAAARGIGMTEASARIILPGSGHRGEIMLGGGTAANFDPLSKIMRRERPALLVLDTLRALFDVDENEARQVAVIGASLTRLAAEHDCSIILAHHTRKPGQFGLGGLQSSVSGSGYLVGMVDTHIALRASDGRFANRLEVVKDRRAADSGRREYAVVGSLINGVSTLTLQPIQAKADKDEERLARMRVLGPQTKKQLEETKILGRRLFRRFRLENRIRETELGSGLWIAA